MVQMKKTRKGAVGDRKGSLPGMGYGFLSSAGVTA
jgi:hypothetical protein